MLQNNNMGNDFDALSSKLNAFSRMVLTFADSGRQPLQFGGDVAHKVVHMPAAGRYAGIQWVGIARFGAVVNAHGNGEDVGRKIAVRQAIAVLAEKFALLQQ